MYFQSELEFNKSNPLKTWELLKTILPRHKTRNPPPSYSLKVTLVKTPQNITNEFNTFLVPSVKSWPQIGMIAIPPILQRLNASPSLSLITPSFNEIKNTIYSLRNNKAVGHDNIPAMFLKVASDIITPFLFVFLDRMFTKGIFDVYERYCKVAKIIPVYKSGAKLDINNYRPISILSSFTKSFQKLICIRLMNFLNKHEIFYPTQYGFQKNKSTTHAALDLVTEMYDNINSN